MSRPGDIGNFDSRAFLVWVESSKEHKIPKTDLTHKAIEHNAVGIKYSYRVSEQNVNYLKCPCYTQSCQLEEWKVVATAIDNKKLKFRPKISFICEEQAKWFASYHNGLFIGEEK